MKFLFMWFLRTIKSSVYDPAFYRLMPEKKGSSALGYFALLIFIFAIFVSITPIREIATFVFQSSAKKDILRQQVLAIYPDELVLTAQGGRISMNVPSPYTIPMPEAIRNESEKDAPKMPENLLVIDTSKPIAVDDFRAYDTLAVLSADSIGFFDQEKGKIQIQSLEKALSEPYTLDKTQFTAFVGTLEKVLKVLGVVFLFLLPLFVFSGMMIWCLFYLLFGALVVWIAAKLRGADWSYGTSYKAGLYLMTVPLAYGALVSPGVAPHLSAPFLFTGILFVMALINITQNGKKEEQPVAATETTIENAPEIK